MHGKYIVIEGTDGSGKSTVGAELIKKLEAVGIKVWAAHEPGSTPIGEAIRTLVKDASLKRSALTELLLFTAARAELAEAIRQKLEAGTWVVSSRNYLSSLVYQGKAGGLGVEFANQVSHQTLPDFYLQPDLTVVIDVDNQLAVQRRQDRDSQASQQDAFESRDNDFQQRLVEGYRQLATQQALPLIDGRGSIEAITEQVYGLMRQRLL